MIKKIFPYILLLILSFSFLQCENGNKTISCFPDSSINVTADLNLPQFQKLASVGGWVYIDAGPLSGTRGLILVRTGLYEFKAYDRNAPHICPGENTTLKVENEIYLYCPEDGAKWILRNGQSLEVTSTPPRSYHTQFSGSIVYISL